MITYQDYPAVLVPSCAFTGAVIASEFGADGLGIIFGVLVGGTIGAIPTAIDIIAYHDSMVKVHGYVN